MRSYLLFLSVFFLSATLVNAQTTEGFETNDVSQFGIEGDGSLSLQLSGGNPGKCLREDDNTLGLGSYVLLSPQYLGYWPVNTDGTDSLFYDYKTVNSSGGSYQPAPFQMEIYGPGGVARYSPAFVLPSFNNWHKSKIPVDSSKWQLVSGSWNSLLQNIERARIYTEFVVGDEYTLIDNIQTTFTPVVFPVAAGLCSSFPANAGFEGWSFMNATSPASINTDGNPPNCLRFTDQGNTMKLIAPPKYKGNWSGLNGTHSLSVDLKIVSTQPTVTLPSYFIQIQGKGGVVKVNLTASQVDSAKGKWFRFEFPLQQNVWQQVSGSWDSTFIRVNDVFIQPEFFSGSGSETVYVDNICIGLLTDSKPLESQITEVIPYPNPAETDISFPLSENIQLVSVLGKMVLSLEGLIDQVRINQFEPGIYILSGQHQGRTWRKRILIQMPK